MELEGKVWKDGKFWLIEVPSLNLMTQGKSRKDALEMAKDAVKGLIECYFEAEMGKGFKVSVNDYKKEVVGVSANDPKLLFALSLRKQREKANQSMERK